jgi:hypothetical protein
MDVSVPLELCITDVIQSQYKDVIQCSGRVSGNILEISDINGDTNNGLINSGLYIVPYGVQIIDQLDGPVNTFGNIGRYRLSNSVVIHSTHGIILLSKHISPSEFILSLPKRKRFLSIFKEFKFDRKYTKHTDDLIVYLYRLLNAFIFKDPILDRVFDYLCRVRENPRELASCSAIRRYLCPELLEQPYYDQLRHIFKENGLSLGDYSTKPLYIIYMSGMLVGYAITNVFAENETLLVSHFDTDVLQEHFMTMNPIIQ